MLNTSTAQELNANQLAVISDFDSEGLSAAIKFTSEEVIDVGEELAEDEFMAGSMTSYVVRGMVSDYRCPSWCKMYWSERLLCAAHPRREHRSEWCHLGRKLSRRTADLTLLCGKKLAQPFEGAAFTAFVSYASSISFVYRNELRHFRPTQR